MAFLDRNIHFAKKVIRKLCTSIGKHSKIEISKTRGGMLIMKKCFTTIIDWIEAEEWSKFIPFIIAALLIPGFVFIYGPYKGNDLTELGANPQAAAADPPKI
ncbi:MAG: hypothetical protein PHI24_12440, partial [Desulfitobacteriaceae bacterium]|nr:hypothetical protein [Desulfitobacteriaceae bacterium]